MPFLASVFPKNLFQSVSQSVFQSVVESVIQNVVQKVFFKVLFKVSPLLEEVQHCSEPHNHQSSFH